MLVDCPKCGFSQPQDQYCAKCGIDMQSYRPKPAPVQARLLANPIFLIAVVFVFVFSGALYIIREQRQQEITRRMDYLKNGPVYAESLQQPKAERRTADAEAADESALGSEVNAATSAAPVSPPPAAAALASHTNAISDEVELSSMGADAPTGDTDAIPDAVAKARAVTVRAYYTLAIRSRLGAMIEASRSQSQFIDFGEFQMGTLRNVKDYLGQLDVVEQTQKKLETGMGGFLMFVGDTNTEPALGLTTKISVRAHSERGIRGEIEILRSLHESPDFNQGIVAKAFGPGEFSAPAQAGLLIVLQLPRVPQYDERSVSPGQFLRLFRMPEFKQSQSEFVLLVDFELEGAAVADSPRPPGSR